MAATAVREQKEANDVAPLRLPKHLQESARADNAMSGEVMQRTSFATASATIPVPKTDASNDVQTSSVTELFKQVHFQQPEEDYEDHGHHDEHEDHEDQDDEEEEDYDHDYDGYYNEVSDIYLDCCGLKDLYTVKLHSH